MKKIFVALFALSMIVCSSANARDTETTTYSKKAEHMYEQKGKIQNKAQHKKNSKKKLSYEERVAKIKNRANERIEKINASTAPTDVKKALIKQVNERKDMQLRHAKESKELNEKQETEMKKIKETLKDEIKEKIKERKQHSKKSVSTEE